MGNLLFTEFKRKKEEKSQLIEGRRKFWSPLMGSAIGDGVGGLHDWFGSMAWMGGIALRGEFLVYN